MWLIKNLLHQKHMTGTQLIIFLAWLLPAMPMCALMDWLFSNYGSEPDPYEGDMRGILGLVWPVTLIPVLIYIGIRIYEKRNYDKRMQNL